jgi:hypothetical protein
MLPQRRPVHDHLPRPFQKLDQPFASDPRHCLVRVVHALAVIEPQGEREGLRDLVPGGRP